MEYFLYELENGLRVIFTPTKSRVSHCGFIINTGSRDETAQENGMTHFIEHCIFKGTNKRKSHHILNRIDSVGGELNAYTTKEKTCVYASFATDYLDRSTELLTNILFDSTFPEKEINKEKAVIIDEINSYKDSPYEQIYDDFEELTFSGHPLARNILGTEKTVNSFSRNDVLSFMKSNYSTDNIVFSIVGNYVESKIKKLIKKHLEVITPSTKNRERHPFNGYLPFNKAIERDVFQAHCMIGNIAYDTKSKNKSAFILLNNILGGPAMNSRLNMGIREKYGFTYNIDSTYTSYSDSGLFAIYLGTDPKYLDRSISLVHRELKKLKNKELSSSQLIKAKQQLMGQITLSEENKANVMLGMGKSLISYNKVDTLDEVQKKISNISSKSILDIANEVFDANQLSTLIYKPKA